MYNIKIFLIFLLFSFCLLASESLKQVIPGRTFVIDKQGNIFVNYGKYSIAKYSPDGELLLTMGQKGEGPGDFKILGWFALNPISNIIYTTEFVGGNRWISKFSLDGKYLGEWDIDFDWVKYNGISIIEFDSSGNAYLQTEKTISNKCKDFSLGSIDKSILKFSSSGKFLKELYKMSTNFFAAREGKGNITIPFHNYLSWVIYKNNLIVREHWSDNLFIYTLDGSLLKKIKLPFKLEKVKNKDIVEWENWIKSFPQTKKSIADGILDLKYWRSRIPFPKYKPLSGDKLYVDSNGNIYSKKYSGFLDIETTWARINIDNSSFSIIRLQKGERIIGIWENYIFLSIKDDEDNYTVVKKDEKEISYANGK